MSATSQSGSGGTRTCRRWSTTAQIRAQHRARRDRRTGSRCRGAQLGDLCPSLGRRAARLWYQPRGPSGRPARQPSHKRGVRPHPRRATGPADPADVEPNISSEVVVEHEANGAAPAYQPDVSEGHLPHPPMDLEHPTMDPEHLMPRPSFQCAAPCPQLRRCCHGPVVQPRPRHLQSALAKRRSRGCRYKHVDASTRRSGRRESAASRGTRRTPGDTRRTVPLEALGVPTTTLNSPQPELNSPPPQLSLPSPEPNPRELAPFPFRCRPPLHPCVASLAERDQFRDPLAQHDEGHRPRTHMGGVLGESCHPGGRWLGRGRGVTRCDGHA